MNEPELWMLAMSAFAAVLLLLSLLAVAIWLLTALFRAPVVLAAPAGAATAGATAAGTTAAGTAGAGTTAAGTTPNATGDAATVAAIHAAVQRTLPGGRVVRIEEVP